ncbi:hypothetical protein [Sphaerospermopsis sp. FACHB-1194]|nr:hypothetical protein [Sphaerospermopsis sp. FACHB-1194]
MIQIDNLSPECFALKGVRRNNYSKVGIVRRYLSLLHFKRNC